MKYLLMYLLIGIIVVLFESILFTIIIAIKKFDLEDYGSFLRTGNNLIEKSNVLSFIVGLIIWPRQVVIAAITTNKYINNK